MTTNRRGHDGRVIVIVQGPFVSASPDESAEIRRAIGARLISEGARVWFVTTEPDELAALTAHGAAIGGHVLEGGVGSVAGVLRRVAEESGGVHGILIEAVPPLVANSADSLNVVLGCGELGAGLDWLMSAAVEAIRVLGAGGSLCLSVSPNGAAMRSGHVTENMATAAVIALAKTLSLDSAAQRISVTALCPGNPVPARSMVFGPADRTTEPEHPAPSEVAALASFLLSSVASFCTGGVFTMNGGRQLSA